MEWSTTQKTTQKRWEIRLNYWYISIHLEFN